MKTYRPVIALLCASLFAALAMPAFAGDTTTTAADAQQASQLATTYTTLAGSDANAQALVQGLHGGTAVTLNDTVTVTNADGTTSTSLVPVTFQPSTGALGYGNVNIALSLAAQELASEGITDPTAAELEAVLNGGSVTLADGTSADLQGVLAMRAGGEGWGQIANSLGVKLGDLVSASKSDHAQAGMDHGSAAADHVVRVDHAVRPEHVVRPQRPERPQLPERPTHVGRPGG
jgi:hypothetical protein